MNAASIRSLAHDTADLIAESVASDMPALVEGGV